MTTTPAQRAKALIEKFGPVRHPHDGDDGFWHGDTTIGDLVLHVSAFSTEVTYLDVTVYDFDADEPALLSLSQVQDDDLVEAIIRQVVDHHHGRQVI